MNEQSESTPNNLEGKANDAEIKLRPHHLISIYANTIMLDSRTPALYKKYYGGISQLAKQIEIGSNRTNRVKLVEGLDDLCTDCKHKPSCEKKEYGSLLEAFRVALDDIYGQSVVCSGSSPDECDRIALEALDLKIGSTCTIDELFKTIEENALRLVKTIQKYSKKPEETKNGD
jgi:hypothetical protein